MEYSRYKRIPNALRRCRESKGLSQSEVAKLLGFKDKTWISHWERGDAMPNLVSILRLAVLYEATVEGLFRDLFNAIHQEHLSRVVGIGVFRESLQDPD